MTVWRHSISWSKFKLAISCQRQLQYTIDKKPHKYAENTYHAAAGKLVQRVFELYFNQKVNLRPGGRDTAILLRILDRILATDYLAKMQVVYPNGKSESDLIEMARSQITNGIAIMNRIKLTEKTLRSEVKWQSGNFFGEALYGLEFFKDSEVDLFLVGHHHEDKGMLEGYGKTFVSHGSITITGTHPHDLARTPAAALIEFPSKTERKVQFVRVAIPPIGDILDLEKHQQLKEEKKEMESLIEALSATEVGTADPLELLREMAPPEEVRKKVQEYLDKAEAQK